MKYMLLIYDDPAVYEGEEGRQLMSKMVSGHTRLGEDLRAAGVAYSGSQLQPPTVVTTVRNTAGAQTLHDGPFAETKEQLGGYYLIEAPDLDAALAWAKKCPGAARGCVEVRPIFPMGGLPKHRSRQRVLDRQDIDARVPHAGQHVVEHSRRDAEGAGVVAHVMG